MEHYVPPRTMTTVVLARTNDQYKIRHDIEAPTGPGYQEVVCKVMAITIYDTDPKPLKGKFYHYHPEEYPFIIGHERPGIVVEVGPGVFNLKVGDQMTGETHRRYGVCKNCKEGRYPLCLNYGGDGTGHHHYGSATYGAYCQYVQCNCGSLTPLPDNVSFEETTMCDTVGITFHGLERAGITPRDTICVIGPDPIGLMSMRIARCLGAAYVVVMGRGTHLKTVVATGVCDPNKTIDFETCKRDDVDVVQKAVEVARRVGPGNVYEASGTKGAMVQAVKMCKKDGSIALLDTPPEGTMVRIPIRKITFKELALFGSRGGPNVTPVVVNLMATDQLRVGDLVTHTFPLIQLGQGINTFINRKDGIMKVIFYPNG